MSFGWSGSDVFLLGQLAWNTVQNSRKACGEYDELTREALRLHAVLQRLEQEVAKPESPINRPGETSKEQLERIAIDCEVVLKQLDKIVTAYASLSEEKRSARKIWQRVRFGNGQMADLGDLRSKLMLCTSEMLLYLNLVSMSTVGRIEQRMDRDGGVLRDIKIAVEKKTAHNVLCGGNWEGSVLTAYTDDDTGFWRGLRRDLIKDGLPSAAIRKHRHLIKEYVKELGARGILDDDLSKESDQQQHDFHANSEIKEEVQGLPNNRDVILNVLQTHDHNVDVQPLEPFEDLNEQSFSDSLNTIAEDVESESSPADSRATVSHNMQDQLHNTIDNVSLRPGAKIKSQSDYNNSKLLEPAHTGNESQNLHSTNSVPFRPAEEWSRTSRNGTNTSRSDAEKPGNPESAAQNDTTSHASSHDGYFPLSIVEQQHGTVFVLTPTEICHERDGLLYPDFGQRISMMLECLPDPNLQVPRTVPGDDPYYAADVRIIASFAQSAQRILRDISSVRNTPPTSMINFRPEDFVDMPDIPENYEFSQEMYKRIRDLIVAFDMQCYDVVPRIRRCIARMSSAYPRHTMPSYPPPTHQDGRDNVSGQQHPNHMDSGGIDGGMPSKQSVRFSTSGRRGGLQGSDPIGMANVVMSDIRDDDDSFCQFTSSKEETIDASGNRDLDDSSSSTKGPHRSGAYGHKPEFMKPSMRPSETRRVDRMRPGHPVPLTSSNLKNMKAPSDTSDSSSDSGSEMTEENHPPPRPMPLQRKITRGISQKDAYVMEPGASQSRPKESRRTSECPFMVSQGGSTRKPPAKESRRTSERPFMVSQGGSTRKPPAKESRRTSERPFMVSRGGSVSTPPVARAVSTTFPSDERRPGLVRQESARALPLRLFGL